ncbi:MAG: helix-turn-helix domain-containing protein [Rhizobiaceae bacterium]|nr:helix-turn-helix domain-containing protein [Rhizobiaceae bacterium]
MPRRLASARRVKIHHSYTVEEASEATGYHKNTIRGWITTKVLTALTEKRPHLILGHVLRDFLAASKPGKVTLKPGECYCVKCRRAQRPALGMAEYVPLSDMGGNLQGICPACETLMHRRVKLAHLQTIAAGLDVKAPHGQQHLTERSHPSLNVDFEEVPDGQSKTLPRE